MFLPVVDALLEAFGPFLIPVALFAAGAVGYAALFLAGRLGSGGRTGWPTGRSETGEESPDSDRHEG